MFDGHLFVVEDQGNSGKILNEIDLGHACLAAPAIARGGFSPVQEEASCFWKFGKTFNF